MCVVSVIAGKSDKDSCTCFFAGRLTQYVALFSAIHRKLITKLEWLIFHTSMWRSLASGTVWIMWVPLLSLRAVRIITWISAQSIGGSVVQCFSPNPDMKKNHPGYKVKMYSLWKWAFGLSNVLVVCPADGLLLQNYRNMCLAFRQKCSCPSFRPNCVSFQSDASHGSSPLETTDKASSLYHVLSHSSSSYF